ncbi:amidohydrolase family protein [Streptomyces blastmyceticus]|uniref:Aminodeoxyfutalosine deaminase/Imidazolonepropionase-like composite domain-containing protein n=1 Tax=Streptomyces blastmyceticus TaxID=68180 RepID=A0ABP3GER1_9ACTN
MLTIHSAELLITGPGAVPLPGGAVAVEGDRIAAVGAYDDVAAAHPLARTRCWPGVLTPGLVNTHAAALLEAAYHPDPREAAELGEEPLTGDRLTALGLDDTRWGGSARRGAQRMLRHGTTAVVGPFTRASVRLAVARAGLAQVRRPASPGPAGLDPLAALLQGTAPDTAFAGTLAPGARADFAVFDVRDVAALAERGAGACVATVLGGRLVYRAR